MAGSTPKSFSTDPTLYLYTSLTAGSSHIVTATARLETILKSNKIEYQALDVATDDQARMLWGRRAGKRKLPGLVQKGMVIGDFEQIEEWNEYGELKEHLGDESVTRPAATTPAASTAPPPSTHTPSQPPISAPKENIATSAAGKSATTPLTEALRKVGEEAAKKAKDAKSAGKVAVRTSASRPGDVDEPAPDAATCPPTKLAAEAPTSGASVAEGQRDPSSTSGTAIITRHRGSDVSIASPEEIREVERTNAIPEEDEDDAEEADNDGEDERGAAKKEEAARGDATPKDKTQDQPAAEGTLAGESVGD